MLGVFIVPTGLGAAIGGHAGDATPAAKLIAACCDQLIVHPNVVNASDINEMSANMLYVDGYMLDSFLSEQISLRPVRQNKILLVANKPMTPATFNGVNAARATIGADIITVKLEKPLFMAASEIGKHQQGGSYSGVKSLLSQISEIAFDALAIHTPIYVPRQVALDYFKYGGINPWGGIEAKTCREISKYLDCPVAHAPLETVTPDDPELYFFDEVVNPRLAAEQISSTFLHCVLKGLHNAPLSEAETFTGLQSIHGSDVDFLISPFCLDGKPHKICKRAGIPIIYVRENTVKVRQKEGFCEGIVVENYLEAAGVVMAMQAGVRRNTVMASVFWEGD